jgi:thymidylate kinase
MDLRSPWIVAFCGIDGAGKSTLVRRLREDPRFEQAHFVTDDCIIGRNVGLGKSVLTM